MARFQIIYLNGPSSSGKSTLAKALQESLETPFLHVGIDKIIGMMPEKMNSWDDGPAPLGFSWRGSELQVGPFAKKISDSYLEIVVLLAKLGHSVVVDDVETSENRVQVWKERLSDFSTIMVGLHSSLAVLQERERIRGDRRLGSAANQKKKIIYDKNYDLVLDTSILGVRECVERILYHNNHKELDTI